MADSGYVARPYVRQPYTPDTRSIGALLMRQSQDQGTAAAIRGATAAQLWENLARGFQQYQNTTREQAEKAASLVLREQERSAAEALKRDELAARQAERDEASRIRREAEQEKQQLAAEKRGDVRAKAIGYGPMAEADVDTVMQSPERAGDVRYAFGPGTAEGPELQPTREQQRGIATEQAIQGMGGTIGPNGQVVMPPKPEKVTWKVEPAIVNGKRQFVRVDSEGRFFDVAGRPVDAQPIPPQGPAPEKPSMWVSKGTEQRLVSPSEAAALAQQGWGPSQTRENPTEDERKTAGFYRRMEDASRVMDETEDKLSQADIYQIQSLPQEDLIGMVNRGKMSEPAKRYIRAMMQFTEARLRADSGAAISAGEYQADRQVYAKQYGETPQLNADRRKARSIAMGGIKTRAGRAMPKPVTMIAPDGTEKDVDPSDVDHYKSLGAKVKG